MGTTEKPPRKRLVAPDSEDDEAAAVATAAGDTAEATTETDPPEEEEEELVEGEVSFKSVASRLGTKIPRGPEGELPPDAFAPILEALEELKKLNLLNQPRLRDKLAKTNILTTLLGILDARPTSAIAAVVSRKPSDDTKDKDNGGDDTTQESSVFEKKLSFDEKQEKRLDDRRRVIYDSLALPVTRALCKLASTHQHIRQEIGTEVLKLKTVFRLLQPGLLSRERNEEAGDEKDKTQDTAEDSTPDTRNDDKKKKKPPQKKQDVLFELALRLMTSVAASSSLASQSICKLIAGADATAPNGSTWFRELLTTNSDDRVVAKAARLTATVCKTKTNRDVLFNATCWDTNRALLNAVYENFTKSENASARKYCAAVLASMCADVGDASVRFNYLRLEGNGPSDGGTIDSKKQRTPLGDGHKFAVADALARAVLWDTDCDVRIVAGNALLGLTQRHVETANALGAKDFARALFATFPELSEQWPAVVVPPPGDEPGEEGGDTGEEEDAAKAADAIDADADKNENPNESSPAPSQRSDVSSAVTVSGHNLFTSHFGLRPVGYVSPPPKVRPVRGKSTDADDDSFFYTDDPYASEDDPRVERPVMRIASGDHHRVFPVVLKLYASIIDAHHPSRLAEAGRISFPVSYLEKVGNVLVKPPNDLTTGDLHTPLTYLLTALRPCAPFVEPEPAPEPTPTPLTEEELAKKEEETQQQTLEKERRRERRHLDGYDTSSSEDDVDVKQDPDSTETTDAKKQRLSLERRTRFGERARHFEDCKKHNDDVRAGVLSVFRALVDTPSFCKAISCVDLYPDAISRIIQSIPRSFDSIEEGARFLVKLGDNAAISGDGFGCTKELFGDTDGADATLFGDGTNGDGDDTHLFGDDTNGNGDDTFGDMAAATTMDSIDPTMDHMDTQTKIDSTDPKTPVKLKLRELGIVDALRLVSASIEKKERSPTSRHVCLVSKMAAETALLVFPPTDFLGKKKPPALTTFYATTPPPPRAPVQTWRAQSTRNVDDAAAGASDRVALRSGHSSSHETKETVVGKPYFLNPSVPGVKILPLHLPLPETFAFVDHENKPLGLIELKQRMIKCVEGAPEAEEELMNREMEEAQAAATAAAAAVEDAEESVSVAFAEKDDAFAELERAEQAAQVLESQDTLAAKHAGVTKTTTHTERFAMTNNFEVVQGERLVAKRRIENARAMFASKTLTAQILAAVLRKERNTLLECEASFESLKQTNKDTDPVGPWGLGDWNSAVEEWASLKRDPRQGPPRSVFQGLKFCLALFNGARRTVDNFATPPYVTTPPNTLRSNEKDASKKESKQGEEGADLVSRTADNAATIGAPPSAAALAQHKLRVDSNLWSDPDGALRSLLTGTGDDSLGNKMKKFTTETLWDFSFAEAQLAKKTFLERVYVKDAARESPGAVRLLKWCYSVVRHVETLETKRRKKELKQKMQGK